MGNSCKTMCISEEKIQGFLPSINKDQRIQNVPRQQKYIDSQGLPLPNAYKRYVKPPTTVGRQSIIVRNLNENQDIPSWIWANENNILNSGTKQGMNRHNLMKNQYLDNRKTYELIQGRFQGQPTINLSKLQFQNKNMTGSQQIHSNQQFTSNQNNFLSSIQPISHPYPSQFTNSINNNTFGPIAEPNRGLKKNYSSEQLFADANVGNANNGIIQSKIKRTQSNIQVSPFQIISQNPTRPNQTNLISNQNGNGKCIYQPSNFSSYNASVNNSIQQPPAMQFNAVRY